MSASTVHVKNISSATSEKEIKEFFSFCGKITSLEVTEAGATKEATVVFEKETAAKTALLLDQTKLGATSVSVTHASSSTSDDDYTHSTERDNDEITQEEKPRTRILAEYIAHGYAIGDQGIQRAIDLDHKHGVSARFLNTLQTLDQKTHATDKAKSVDESYQITKQATNVANSLWSGLSTYYEKAAGTPTGQKLVNFYTQQQRQVIDIHNEARRLADLKKKDVQTAGNSGVTTCRCADEGSCPCKAGACACANCSGSKTKGLANVAAAGTEAVDSTKIAPLEPSK